MNIYENNHSPEPVQAILTDVQNPTASYDVENKKSVEESYNQDCQAEVSTDDSDSSAVTDLNDVVVYAEGENIQDELVQNAPKKPYDRKLTEGRRRRLDKFRAWFEQKKKDLNEEAKNPIDLDDEKMSAKALIHSATQIISEPREYQLELFELAKQMNCLAVLDTGSGKTLIACLLIRHIVNQELEARQRGERRRVSLFLVDSVTLVFQQTAVLNCNLDAKIGKYCGDLCTRIWDRDSWQKILEEDQVLVMTADILGICLTHSFITMEDINLLCFDEAHHAKKNHVYARIIKDFYLPTPEEKRPKIFGMTASPVDARVDVVKAATELESLLHSRIITTSDLSLLQSSVRRPDERIIPYPKLPNSYNTPLCKTILQRFGDDRALRKIFSFVEESTSQLGAWCTDQVWKFALSEVEARKLERKAERMLDNVNLAKIPELEAEIEKIRKAKEFIESYEFVEPKFTAEDTSSKVLLLKKFLDKTYRESEAEKCIIFVQRRWTAKCLYELFKDSVSPHLKLGILVGSRTGMTGEDNFTFRQQMLSVSRFRRGKLNCLIATSVAEEGLDIPDCSMVVRFDLYTTMIQYIQSRGRARQSNSKYFHMIEQGNAKHLKILKDVRNAEEVMRNFCQSLPDDRLLDNLHATHKVDDNTGEVYIEPTTGAKLTFSSAMMVVAHYVGTLPLNGDEVPQPTYIIRANGLGQFVCELVLPASSAVTPVEGPPMKTKATAKRAAAFEVCMRLRKENLLNEYLLPKYRIKELPKFANARLAVDLNKTNTYNFRRKPSFWDVKDDEPPTELWITIITLTDPEEMRTRPSLRPICIATRHMLPDIPVFPIFGTDGGRSNVILRKVVSPLKTDQEVIRLLDVFTDRVFYDVFNKHFEFTYNTTHYWIAPVNSGAFDENSLAMEILNWELLRHVGSNREVIWNPEYPIENLVDRFLVDRVDRSRRFIVLDIVHRLTPKDRVPETVAKGAGFENILDYSYNAGKKRRWQQVKWEIPETEPVFLANRVLHRLNFLENPREKEHSTVTEAVICPSPFHISMIPAAYVHSLIMFASISSRIDGYLHAWGLCKILKLPNLPLDLALEAITKDSDNTSDVGTEPVNKQRGMGNNYERLEFLGDCYLKLATSISLMCLSQSDDEFKLHVKRMVLVCNQNLFNNALKIQIPDYIQSHGFSRRTWYPEMKLLHGKGFGKNSQPNTHNLGDKSVADVCEALIGAALLGAGLDGATKMVSSILQLEEHAQQKWTDYHQSYLPLPAYQVATPTASQVQLAKDIESQFGYKFKSPRLLMSAFTHSSNPYSWEKVPCYQRLEFLGDALLDLACVRYIFVNNPDADPQWLTEHKMAMVSNRFLGACSVLLGFHNKIRKVGQQLDIAIADYMVEILEARERNSAPNFWSDLSLSAPPKVLPDVLEAFIGALFVDSEFDYSQVEDFFDKNIRPYFVDMSIYDDFAGQHPTTFLTKKLTGLGCENWGWECDQYRSEAESYVVAAILIHGEVFAFGKGLSAKNARVQASETALKKLNSLKGEEFGELCKCRSGQVIVD